MNRTGFADLPLHGGQCPRWLFKRMVPLSKAICDAINHERGTRELLARLSNPYFFQSLSCAIGFDWHSSGTTTTTCGALKQALRENDYGLFAAGGKGKASRKTPLEIKAAAEKQGFTDAKTTALLKATRMSAKVDSSCVQDGFELYHHSFFFNERGEWTVVQQGMNAEQGGARRYHWHSRSVASFVEKPHEGIACDFVVPKCLDLTNAANSPLRGGSVELLQERSLRTMLTGQTTLTQCTPACLKMHSHHEVLPCDLNRKSVERLMQLAQQPPENFEQLAAAGGVGGRTLRALALTAEIVYGTPVDWSDPAKYSFAHGGKDGFPYPVDRKLYDNTIETLRNAIDAAELGNREKLDCLERLARNV